MVFFVFLILVREFFLGVLAFVQAFGLHGSSLRVAWPKPLGFDVYDVQG